MRFRTTIVRDARASGLRFSRNLWEAVTFRAGIYKAPLPCPVLIRGAFSFEIPIADCAAVCEPMPHRQLLPFRSQSSTNRCTGIQVQVWQGHVIRSRPQGAGAGGRAPARAAAGGVYVFGREASRHIRHLRPKGIGDSGRYGHIGAWVQTHIAIRQYLYIGVTAYRCIDVQPICACRPRACAPHRSRESPGRRPRCRTGLGNRRPCIATLRPSSPSGPCPCSSGLLAPLSRRARL